MSTLVARAKTLLFRRTTQTTAGARTSDHLWFLILGRSVIHSGYCHIVIVIVYVLCCELAWPDKPRSYYLFSLILLIFYWLVII
jgi:hypothetical protein